MPLYLVAFLIGLVAGLRTFTAPAAVSWAARLGWISVQGTPLAFIGAAVTTWIFTLAAVFEIVVVDNLPKTGSRKSPPQFIGRILSGALCGAAVGASFGALAAALVLGVIGAVAGTLGGYEFRSRLARAAGKDLPIAILEDAIAVALALWVVSRPH
ncbi:MAG TPA: DUF4126 domain-containing protein [Thermoanaerobaculia bacterium]